MKETVPKTRCYICGNATFPPGMIVCYRGIICTGHFGEEKKKWKKSCGHYKGQSCDCWKAFGGWGVIEVVLDPKRK